MVGSLRSWLEKSRNEATRPRRSRTHWRPPEPPTAESSRSPPGSRRPNARSSQPWLLPLRQRRVRPPSASAGRPRPQPHRQLPRSDRLAGRARPRPHLRPPSGQSGGPGSQRPPRPSEQSAGHASPQQRRHPQSGPSGDLGRQRPRPLQRLPSDRSEGRGRVRSRTPHRLRAGSTDAVPRGVRRSPEPNPDPLGQVSTGFG
jgi:hypothetical protein